MSFITNTDKTETVSKGEQGIAESLNHQISINNDSFIEQHDSSEMAIRNFSKNLESQGQFHRDSRQLAVPNRMRIDSAANTEKIEASPQKTGSGPSSMYKFNFNDFEG